MSSLLSTYTGSRDNNFNLIRFLAATLVLISHSHVLVTGSSASEPLKTLLGRSIAGISVDIFFVISGFLITGSFFARKNTISFLWARVLRIYPALIAAVLFCVFAVGLTFTTSPLYEYLFHKQTFIFIARNSTSFFNIATDLPGVFNKLAYENVVNGSLWTLHHEVRMYLFTAIIGSFLLLLQAKGRKDISKAAFLIIAILAVGINLANHFLTFTQDRFFRLFSMYAIGAALYAYRDKIVMTPKLCLPIAILLALSAFHKDMFMATYSLLLPYLVLYIAFVPAGVIRQFNRIGDYSYGMYIYAFPVQQSIAAVFKKISVAGMIALALPTTFALAFLSWHLIEKKSLKMKSYDEKIRNALQKLRA